MTPAARRYVMTEKRLRNFRLRVRQSDTGCWEWDGAKNSWGYATLGSSLAGRLAYTYTRVAQNGMTHRRCRICTLASNRRSARRTRRAA